MGFVGFVSIMLILHVFMFVFQFCPLYYVLCCVVHTMFMIKCLLDVFCVSIWIPLNTKVVGIIMFL